MAKYWGKLQIESAIVPTPPLINTWSNREIGLNFDGTVNANIKLEKQRWRVETGENIDRCRAPTLVEQRQNMTIFGNTIRAKRFIRHLSKRQVLGWLAVALSTSIACFWAFWGIIENFHEGWFHTSLLLNVGLMFVQYLSPLIIFVSLSLLAIAFPRVGGAAHALIGLLLALLLFDLNDRVAMLFVIIPMLSLGMLYWHGRPQPRRAAYWIIAGLPTLTLIICGVEPTMRVAGRVNDGNLEERLIEGNGVRLKWAAEGVGWPREGVSWHEAAKRCRQLSEDGRSLADTPKNVWRLPTVDEAVRLMSRHGANSGGVWNAQTNVAIYRVRPDKESPLWNVHSQVIYWWTATEVDGENAYIIVYDGKIWSRRKRFAPGTLGYRCVK